MSTEVKAGYKLTEVGSIPGAWSATTIGENTKWMSGGTPSRSNPEFWRGSIPWISGSTLKSAEISTSDQFLTPEAISAGSKMAPIESTLLLVRGSALHNEIRAGLVVSPVSFNQDVKALVPASTVYPKFLTYYILGNSDELLKLVSSAGNTAGVLDTELVQDFKFLKPPIHEQKAIATALSDMDALISGLDQLIAKKRDIKQAAMQQLFTGQTRLPGFSGEWRILKLETICAFITKGSTPTTYGFRWESSGILFLRSECVAEQGLDLSQSMFISEAAHNTLRRSEICGGDLLITITGNVGRVILLRDGFPLANINQHIARVRVISPEVDSRFVYHFLSLPDVRKKYNSITTGQAYPQISLKQVRETEVHLPALAEQVAIAQILSDMEAELTALEVRREKAKQLKQGMMQELLTGRIRLV